MSSLCPNAHLILPGRAGFQLISNGPLMSCSISGGGSSVSGNITHSFSVPLNYMLKEIVMKCFVMILIGGDITGMHVDGWKESPW
ncbi:hypothetical protein DPEC_G00333860 [Dallia pectoralis]|uniref:Uncharacterized protein n=1 Tax=Dallia pectoralis TaxID=75939 RepID=A0ACC2F6I4_DALPE|nr:hypothetical protein DPEC_G00333860 [Dallia pectoralis]